MKSNRQSKTSRFDDDKNRQLIHQINGRKPEPMEATPDLNEQKNEKENQNERIQKSS